MDFHSNAADTSHLHNKLHVWHASASAPGLHAHALHRVDFNHAKREETLNEKKAHLDMQNIMEQHHKAKVTHQTPFACGWNSATQYSLSVVPSPCGVAALYYEGKAALQSVNHF